DQRFLDTTSRDSVIPVVAAAERRLGPRLRRMSPEKARDEVVTAVAGSVRGLATFKPSKDADIIQIITQAGDPRQAALITNIYAQIYEKDNQDQNRSKAKSLKDYLAQKLGQIRDSLAKQEIMLRNYREGKGIIGLNGQTQDLLDASSQLSGDATSTQIEI